MNILILSLGPVFSHDVHGGSQKILREISIALGREGNEVTILCTSRPDNQNSFVLSKNVLVKPVLPFRHIFPQPFKTNPYNISLALEIIAFEKQKADILYAHDSGINFSQCYNDKPTVLSIRELVYPETIVGAINFYGDYMITNSNYSFEVLSCSISKINPKALHKTIVIPNGINLEHFYPMNKNNLRKSFGFNNNDIVLLSPHRPEKDKGHENVLIVASKLKKELGKKHNLVILIPKYIDLAVSNEKNAFYDSINQLALELGLEKNIKYYCWANYSEMPKLYNIANITFSLGSYVESFPNVSLESFSCGTPSITVNVGAHRSILPESICTRIDYNDWDSAVNESIKLIKMHQYKYEVVRNFIAEHYDFDAMINSYSNTITKATLNERFIQINLNNKPKNKLILAPWCYVTHDYKIYHDYLNKFYNNKSICKLLISNDVLKDNLYQNPTISSEFEHLIKNNYLIYEN